jgi:hypothetical protein
MVEFSYFYIKFRNEFTKYQQSTTTLLTGESTHSFDQLRFHRG